MKFEVYSRTSELDVPADVAFAWHARPGAFERLNRLLKRFLFTAFVCVSLHFDDKTPAASELSEVLGASMLCIGLLGIAKGGLRGFEPPTF